MTGCGPEAPAAELDDVCQEASPFRLPELGADEQLAPVATVAQIDERRDFERASDCQVPPSSNRCLPSATIRAARRVASSPVKPA
jgi:hypothetical protein